MSHEGLWQQLAKLDPEETARLARCRYVADGAAGRFIVKFLGEEYAVDLTDKAIFLSGRPGVEREPAGFLEQLCILAYLIHAQNEPLSDELLGEKSLRGGDFYFQSKVHELPTKKLEEAFGRCPEKLYDVMGRFHGERSEFGDASIQLFVLPRIPLTVVIWAADEEFAAQGRILFDRTATDHLPLDALAAAASLTIKALVRAAASDE